MKEWAEHQFGLSKPDQNKVSLRDHLEQVERQTGRRPKELDPPRDFPRLLIHVWTAFISLSNSRQPSFSGAGPITYQDIKCWMELTHNKLSSRDVETIMELDRIYLKVMNGSN